MELYQEFMEDISREIDREAKIIDDLLTLVRMDRSSPDLTITSVSVNALVAQVMNCADRRCMSKVAVTADVL